MAAGPHDPSPLHHHVRRSHVRLSAAPAWRRVRLGRCPSRRNPAPAYRERRMGPYSHRTYRYGDATNNGQAGA